MRTFIFLVSVGAFLISCSRGSTAFSAPVQDGEQPTISNGNGEKVSPATGDATSMLDMNGTPAMDATGISQMEPGISLDATPIPTK